MCTAPDGVPTADEPSPSATEAPAASSAPAPEPSKPEPAGPGVRKAETKACVEKGDGFAPSDLPRVFGRYVLLRRIARGGMGEVFLACTMGIEGAERPVVVKLIRREHLGDRSFLARFLDEARVQAQLSHRGVAQVLEAATDDSSSEPYVVVEYVDGRSLGDVRSRSIQVGERIDWVEAVSIGVMIAEALGYVHDRQDVRGGPLGIVHRDLSPQNVMLSFEGDTKIIDFGTARGQNRRCHTVAGVVFAKPGYVAPEVANGDPGDGRVDLYALGVMIWELCMGRRFLQGESAEHMARVSKNELDPPPLAERLGAPKELDGIIAKLTAHDRETRYHSGADAARDLAKLLSDVPPVVGGERSVRARVRELMHRLFADEPKRMRKAFARLVESARPIAQAARNQTTAPSPATFADDESEGLLPGTRYRLLGELGRGGSSIVYRAEHVDLGRQVALKVLDGAMTHSTDFAERLRREAKTLSKLAHPNLVELYDFGRSADGRLFCVMELCAGETLAMYLGREQPIDVNTALKFTGQILTALEVAHAAGLIHRDIKPENVLVTEDGQLKLLDFGLAGTAEELSSEAESDKPVLSGVTLFGTPEYMAPEQATGGKIDARADIYAVGCVLYEMLTGQLPFQKDSAVGILEAKIKGSPARTRDIAPDRDISEEVDELCSRAIARHPSLRLQTASEMRELVEALLEDRAPKRKRGKAAVGLGLVAAAGLALAMAVPYVGDVSTVRGWMQAYGSDASQVDATQATALAGVDAAQRATDRAVAEPALTPDKVDPQSPAADVPRPSGPAERAPAPRFDDPEEQPLVEVIAPELSDATERKQATAAEEVPAHERATVKPAKPAQKTAEKKATPKKATPKKAIPRRPKSTVASKADAKKKRRAPKKKAERTKRRKSRSAKRPK